MEKHCEDQLHLDNGFVGAKWLRSSVTPLHIIPPSLLALLTVVGPSGQIFSQQDKIVNFTVTSGKVWSVVTGNGTWAIAYDSIQWLGSMLWWLVSGQQQLVGGETCMLTGNWQGENRCWPGISVTPRIFRPIRFQTTGPNKSRLVLSRSRKSRDSS